MSEPELFSSLHKPPLAKRMAPRSLDEFVGQEHLLSPGMPLRALIENDRLSSLILWGPPGCGKSAVAGLIAGRTKAVLVRLNAVTSTVEDLRQLKREAMARLATGGRTILFLDEIHRFNRAQQDALLPDVEEGLYILVGTTTHNPYFSITRPLLSRSRVFPFSPLSAEHVEILLKRALDDSERGLGGKQIEASPEALSLLARLADGDARAALTGLELAYMASAALSGPIRLTAENVARALQERHARYDRDEDEHYQVISAFIKSVRGSDPDAAIYWLARMIAGGEDPRFIARRLVILASEDIGNADPHGLLMASAGMHAVETIGLPEAQICLAQVTAYLACAPKSNASYKAINAALEEVKEGPMRDVPLHLRNASFSGAEALGYAKEYRYPHDFPGGHVAQEYMPDPKRFYFPTDRGVEARFKAYLDQIRKKA